MLIILASLALIFIFVLFSYLMIQEKDLNDRQLLYHCIIIAEILKNCIYTRDMQDNKQVQIHVHNIIELQ